MSGPTLSIVDLCADFRIGGHCVPVLEDVSFDVQPGEIIGLVGESGSGKSVTAYSVMGLLDAPGRIRSGAILYKGRDLTLLADEDMRRIRGHRIAMVFQDSNMSLNPVLRIDTQMTEAIAAHEKASRAEARRRARDALGLVGIPSPEERLSCYPHQLSGGMRQRVAIAIAMLHRPDVIIADEPTTALDVTIQAQILSEMQQLTRQNGTALVWITHDLSVVSGLTDSIVVMYGGRVVEAGETQAVLDEPCHPYTRGLIGSIPSANQRGQRLTQIPGQTPGLGSRILIEGQDRATMQPADAKATKLKVQMVFQDPFGSLNPRMRIGEIIGEAPLVHGLVSRAGLQDYVDSLLARTGLEPRTARASRTSAAAANASASALRAPSRSGRTSWSATRRSRRSMFRSRLRSSIFFWTCVTSSA